MREDRPARLRTIYAIVNLADKTGVGSRIFSLGLRCECRAKYVVAFGSNELDAELSQQR